MCECDPGPDVFTLSTLLKHMATHLAYRVLSNIHTIIKIKATHLCMRAYAPIEIYNFQNQGLFLLQFQERVGISPGYGHFMGLRDIRESHNL